MCEDYMMKNIELENVCDLFALADRVHAAQLKTFCMNWIVSNWSEVFKKGIPLSTSQFQILFNLSFSPSSPFFPHPSLIPHRLPCLLSPYLLYSIISIGEDIHLPCELQKEIRDIVAPVYFPSPKRRKVAPKPNSWIRNPRNPRKFSKIAIWRREIGDLDMYVYGWEWVIVVAAFASCIFVNVQMDRSAWLQLYSEETLKESNVLLFHSTFY